MRAEFIFLIIISTISSSAQSFLESKDCNVNVNDLLPIGTSATTPLINSSTFKFSQIVNIDGEDKIQSCSGTLLNRFVNDSELGYYFITAKHCTKEIQENQLIWFMFNYQSPTGVSNETIESNEGNRIRQSKLYDYTPLNDDSYEYYHESYVRKVDDFWWGDLALYEILKPIPPHFNVSYAGWNPSAFIPTYIPTPCISAVPARFKGIHHPRGDRKKVSGVNNIIINYTPISTGCYTVTTVIDFLFGWLWGNTVSTQVICNYVDVGWLTVPLWCYGITEKGSSGSGLFDNYNKLIGVTSGGVSGCVIPGPDFYGKFHNKYVRQVIKNTLNPGNSQYVDLFGLESRKIECYNYLELPGEPGVSGEYFPAKHYQAENKVILRSASNIDVTQPIIIYPEANYEFHAPGEITFNGNVDIMEGAEFETFSSPCTQQRMASPQSAAYEALSQIIIPSKKESKIERYNTEIELVVFPNPSENIVNLNIKNLSAKETVQSVKFINLMGQNTYIKSEQLESDKNSWKAILDISELASGIYIVVLETQKKTYSERFVKK